ncbi:hypothetical protein OS493_036295 [Desmophyllum pertusum]|uniref:Uncharacterized protein n=1 Tax=Desmophyllum pertusum TaxID=174260 RepID=A0A9X0CUL8_9CNID|nr:hypothetical protein OS493_036295 [Desmophyllum pertusum]
MAYVTSPLTRTHLSFNQVFLTAWIIHSSTSFTHLCLILWISQLVKLKVLCLCLDHETLNLPGSMGVPLMQCLVPLLKRVQQGIGGKTVVAAVQKYFWYYNITGTRNLNGNFIS